MDNVNTNNIDTNAAANNVATSAENVTHNNDTNSQTADASLETAFDQLATAWDANNREDGIQDLSNLSKDSTSTPGASVSNSQPEDGNNGDNSEGLGDNSSPEENKNTPNANLDYQQLYQQMLEEKKLQQQNISLLSSRLTELSEQYQNLKHSVKEREESAAKKEVDTVAPEIQELYELYPDIATAVDKMIESKTKSAKESIKEEQQQQNMQLQQSVQYMAQQQFVNKVLSVHPDLPELIQNNVLRNWADGLDSVSKAGAHHIMQYGSADDIISLVNQYKSSTQKAVTPSNQTKTVNETLINKVKSAMSVPSNRQEPIATNNSGKPRFNNEDEAFAALAKDYEMSHGFRRML